MLRTLSLARSINVGISLRRLCSRDEHDKPTSVEGKDSLLLAHDRKTVEIDSLSVLDIFGSIPYGYLRL